MQSIQNLSQRFIARETLLIENPGELTCFKSEMKQEVSWLAVEMFFLLGGTVELPVGILERV